MNLDLDKEQLASELRGSLLRFTQFFYPLLTGRQFIISEPPGRESHFITISRALTRASRLEIPQQRLLINTPPGSGKSTLLVMWTAWTLAQFPDSRYLYISYSKVLAAKHTESIKRILMLPHFNYLFGVKIRHDSKAREYFQTTAGGAIAAFGSGGAITGQDAGLPGLDRFSGAVIIDDAHKPDEVHSDTIRLSVIDNYRETIQQRARGINVPSIFIGQRLHEDDLAAYLIEEKDGHIWEKIIIQGIDEVGNPFYPEVYPLTTLRIRQEKDPYVFASQFQQNPIPAGGALFKPDWFVLVDEDPKIIASFITADTAETSKSYNDATAFSFWGVYEIESYGKKTGEYGLHWIDCLETRIEPKDLKDTFLDFWAECMRYPVPPKLIAIEKKSTGGTLLSLIDEIRAIQLRDIPRTRVQGNKTKRFLEAQPYVAEKRISFNSHARHTKLCIEHMSKITANETHRWDDICLVRDTKISCYNGDINIQDIKIGDKIITPFGMGFVTAIGSTGIHKVVNRFGLEGTPNHKVFYQNEFVPLISVIDMLMLNRLTFKGILKWKQRQLLYSMEKNLDYRQRESISVLAKENIKVNSFIAWFGNSIQERKFLKISSFIIKTIINLIIASKIWSVYRLSNIARYILKENLLVQSVKKLWKKCGKIQNELNQQKNTERKRAHKQKSFLMQIKKSIAVFVKRNLLGSGLSPTYVAQNVEEFGLINGGEKDISVNQFLHHDAYIAERNLLPNKQYAKEIIEKHAQMHAHENMDMKEVFNLTVEPYGVYYANGILVSNCDTAADAIKFALIDKIIIQASKAETDFNQLAKTITLHHNKLDSIKKAAYRR